MSCTVLLSLIITSLPFESTVASLDRLDLFFEFLIPSEEIILFEIQLSFLKLAVDQASFFLNFFEFAGALDLYCDWMVIVFAIQYGILFEAKILVYNHYL